LNPTDFTTHLTPLPPEKGGFPSGKTERKGILILGRKERNQLTPEHTELIENFILKPIDGYTVAIKGEPEYISK
jgi:hypothetical protein